MIDVFNDLGTSLTANSRNAALSLPSLLFSQKLHPLSSHSTAHRLSFIPSQLSEDGQMEGRGCPEGRIRINLKKRGESKRRQRIRKISLSPMCEFAASVHERKIEKKKP